MAGRSEDIEALLVGLEDLVAAEYAAAALAKFEEAEGKSADDRLEVTSAVAKAGRAVKLFRGAGARAIKAITALRAPKASDAEETAMNDDDSRWTPERIAELHAKVRERMEKFVGSLEFKRMAERDLAQPDRAVPADPPVPGGPPASAG
jgi:hypothetical protein